MAENEAGRLDSDIRRQVVSELKDFFDTKFDELKRDFKEDTEWITENVRKKVRTDNSISLKSASNRKQFQFNSELSDLLDSSKRAIELRNASKAIEYIEDAQSKLKHRNKIIRIADSSPAGWATIAEYEQYDVASDSDDDKKIRRAEQRAKSKLEKVKNASDNSSATNFRSFRRPLLSGRTGLETQSARFVQDVVCFVCGEVGHYASGCPNHWRRRNALRSMATGAATATVTSPQPPVGQKSGSELEQDIKQ